jgi:hypothetical protein
MTVKNTSRKGYNKCTAFDKLAAAWGWEKIHGEHRYRTGPIFRTCNIAGFDRLYATIDGPVLVEVTDAGDYSSHREEILLRYHGRPLLFKNFKVLIALYYGGPKRLDRRTDEKRWTKQGIWAIEWLNPTVGGFTPRTEVTKIEPAQFDG